MMKEFNKLTERLLAEGYTKDHFPDYVKEYASHYGGFQYKRSFSDELVFETPCGLRCKGRSAFDGLCWMGTEYTFENGNPIIRCPKDCYNCQLRDEPFRIKDEGYGAMECSLHQIDAEWQFEGSCEQIAKESKERRESQFEAFREERHGRVCRNQCRYNFEKHEWEMNFSGYKCLQSYCAGKCPVLGRELTTEKGNIYFDIETDQRDTSKDGTFFEGERIRTITKGLQFFPKPNNLDKIQTFLKTERSHFEWLIKTNVMPKIASAWTMFHAELGEIDFKWRILNVRIEKRNVRDLDEDLQNIQEGTIVVDAKEQEKKEKQFKREKREAAKEKRKESMRKLIVRKGLEDMDEDEKRRAVKMLEANEIIKAQHDHEKAREAEKTAPKQMSIFEFMEETT